MILNENGAWIGQQDKLKQYITGYFSKLFDDFSVFYPFCLANYFLPPKPNEINLLGKDIFRQEVYATFHSMKGYQAPSSDELQAMFFQSQWHVVGNDLVDLVQSIFCDLETMAEINDTFITLIL